MSSKSEWFDAHVGVGRSWALAFSSDFADHFRLWLGAESSAHWFGRVLVLVGLVNGMVFVGEEMIAWDEIQMDVRRYARQKWTEKVGSVQG